MKCCLVVKGGPGGTNVCSVLPSAIVVGSPGAVGVSPLASRCDHAHPFPATAGVLQRWYEASNYDGNLGDYRVQQIGGTGAHRFTFDIPNGFVSLVSLVFRCVAAGTVVDVDIDLASDYALPGENFAANSETDAGSVYSFTANEIAELDISPVFSSLAAGQSCGVFVDHKGIGTTIRYLGIRMIYMGT